MRVTCQCHFDRRRGRFSQNLHCSQVPARGDAVLPGGEHHQRSGMGAAEGLLVVGASAPERAPPKARRSPSTSPAGVRRPRTSSSRPRYHTCAQLYQRFSLYCAFGSIVIVDLGIMRFLCHQTCGFPPNCGRSSETKRIYFRS